ncbi:MAG: PilN domain-containing protein [Alphaproteobacteria bacterium]
MTESGATLKNMAAANTASGREGLLRHGRAFLAWWMAELSGLLPGGVRTWLSGKSGRAGLIPEGDRLRLIDLRGGQSRPLRDLNLAEMTPAAAREAIERALRNAGLRDCPVVLGLPEPMVLRRRESLPAGAERRLDDILRLRLESTAPLPPGTFYWGYRIAGPAAEGRLPVECVLVKAETVEALAARMAELGVELSGVFPAADLPGHPALNLMPGHLRHEPPALWSPLNRRLAVLAAVLAVLVLGLSFYRQESSLEALDAELADLRRRAASVVALRTDARERLQSLRTVREMKATAPSLMGILNEVSRLLPDGTWVSDFRLQDGEIRLTGRSESASSLIGLIERSPVFANVRFGSPVVRDPQTGIERFNIYFDWAGAASARADGGGP